jgi:drug/metabolite transporter (DMT)-like permease
MKTQNKKLILADSAMILMALIWGGGFAGNKILLNDGMQPMQLIALRFIIASVLLLAVFAKKFKKDKALLSAGLLIGFVLAVSFIIQTVGLKYTTASNNAFLTSVYVILVPLAAYFITGRRPDKYNLAAALLVIAGIFLLTVNFSDFSLGRTVTFKGDMLTLISAAFYGVEVSLVAYYSRKFDPVLLAVIQIIFVALFSSASALIFEGPHFIITRNGVFILLYLSVLSTALCLLLQNIAQKYTSPTHAGILMSLESVFGTLMGVLILHERITSQMFAGFFIIFIALIVAETKLVFIKSIPRGGKKTLADKKTK